MRASVIIPFHRRLDDLRRCLDAIRDRPDDIEIIVVADGATEDCGDPAAVVGATVLRIPGPSGPAVARNRGAAVATAPTLVFVDSDVVASVPTLCRLVETLEAHTEVAAVFGSYDESPAAPNFVSRYKNLAHGFVHQSSRRVSGSFWSGLGAIRADVFRRMGGFDERLTRACIEDIELGYRLSEAGHRVLLDPGARACHLKRWSLWSLIRSDVFDRGIPWTQLLLRTGRLPDDLNLRTSYRASVVVAYVLLGSLGLTVVDARALWVSALAVIGLLVLNRRFYTFFLTRCGLWFTLGVVLLHTFHHLLNGVSFIAGSVIYAVGRWTGHTLRGAVPLALWKRPSPEHSGPTAGPPHDAER